MPLTKEDLLAIGELMDVKLEQSEKRMITRMDGKFAQMDGKFAQMDEKFAQMDERLEQSEKRLIARMDERLEQSEKRMITRIEDAFEMSADMIRGVENRLTARMGDGFARVDGKLAGLQQEQTKLRVDMEKGFKEISETITEVVDAIDAKIERLETTA